MNHWTVYKYTFPNGKCYVGATKRKLTQRQGSKESGWSRYKNCKSVWGAIQEFGVESIHQTIIFEGDCEDKDAMEIERSAIAESQSNNSDFGYNVGRGGEGLVKTVSEKRMAEMKDAGKQLAKTRVGKRASEETRARQRAAKLGRKFGPRSEETKRKISDANSLKNLSLETRMRKSLSHVRMVLAISQDSGEEILFGSQQDAAEFFGVRDSAVSRWISGVRNPSNGYKFINYPPTTTE